MCLVLIVQRTWCHLWVQMSLQRICKCIYNSSQEPDYRLTLVWPHWEEQRSLGVTTQEARRAFVPLTLIAALILFGERGYVLLHRGLSGPQWEGRGSACPKCAIFIAVRVEGLLAAELHGGAFVYKCACTYKYVYLYTFIGAVLIPKSGIHTNTGVECSSGTRKISADTTTLNNSNFICLWQFWLNSCETSHPCFRKTHWGMFKKQHLWKK